MKDNVIVFETEDGNKTEFSVLEQTTLGGKNYLLVACDEDDSFLLLRENIDACDDDMVSYDIVEDEKELEAVIKIFEELLEDVDLEV